MSKRALLMLLGVALALPAAPRAQGSVASFVGTWKLEKVDPPLPAGRGGRGGGGGAPQAGGAGGAAPAAAPAGRGGRGGGNAAYEENVFTAAPTTVAITQSGNSITVQVGGQREVFTLDDKLTVTPEGDLNALKTHAHWDGAKLHLHFKQGMNFGRDILSTSGTMLTVVRDLEAGGTSTTRTLTYAKTS